MKVRNAVVLGCILTAMTTTLPGTSQTLRERLRERKAVEQREGNSAFPAKGKAGQATTVSMTFDGVKRSYLIERPAGESPFPVVILLHGGTEDAEQVWRQTSLPTLAQSEGFILVAPNALNKHWNDGRGAVLGGEASSADDLGFLKEVIAQVIANDGGDAKAIFLVGASNGGFMTMHFACESPGLLRAASYAISDLPFAQKDHCAAPPMPWLAMNGTADPIVPFDGMKAGTIKNGTAQPELLSANDTFDFWAKRDNCGAFVSDRTLPHLNPADPTTAEERVCDGTIGLRSTQYVFHGGGHSVPNLQYGAFVQRIVGDSNQDVDAGQVIWNFFKGTLKAN